jgi:phage terminase small subunit
MNQRASETFKPPSPQQVTDHLQRCAPRVSRSWVTQLPLMLLLTAALMTLFAQNAMTAVLPWMILIGVVTYAMIRVRHVRNIQNRVMRISEWTQLEQHERATRAIWKILPIVQMMPELHGRLVALMAHNLDRLTAWPAAEVAYDYLIQRMPADHPGSIQLQLQRTVLQLFNDELSSADSNLRKLRPMAMELGVSPISATYHYAALLQQVRTYHFADAVAENKDALVEQLRPLGVDAGYGYALLAWCCYQLSLRNPDDPQWLEQARDWWHRATLLLPTQKLFARQDELKTLAANLAYQPVTQEDQAGQQIVEQEPAHDLDEVHQLLDEQVIEEPHADDSSSFAESDTPSLIDLVQPMQPQIDMPDAASDDQDDLQIQDDDQPQSREDKHA